VLTIVPQASTDRFDDARALLYVIESWRPALWVMVELLLLPLLGLGLLLGGAYWGGLLIGAAVSLGLSRYGPHWWPGKR
jgi:hypothetical protein